MNFFSDLPQTEEDFQAKVGQKDDVSSYHRPRCPSEVDLSKPLILPKSNGYYIPIKSITEETAVSIEESFTYRFYKENVCNNCEHKDDRFNEETCGPCASFLGARRTVKPVIVKEKTYLRVPRGGGKRLQNILKYAGHKNIKSDPKYAETENFSRRIKCTATLRDYQEEAVQAILEHKFGIIESPPRSGKTLIGSAAVCIIGGKTLILASQLPWLNQFRETFIGSDTAEAFTTAKPSQVKICKTYEDFLKTDICLATFATFFSPRGLKLLRKIRKLFKVVLIDEVHFTAAKATSMVLSEFSAEYMIGLTGTPARKVEEEFRIVNDFVGKVIYRSTVESLTAKVALLEKPPGGPFTVNGKDQGAFGRMISRLEGSKKRKEYICKFAIRQAKKGHLVIIPMQRVQSCLEWVRYINEITETRGFAQPYVGSMSKEHRNKVVQIARNYKCRIVIGNIALLSTGLNIPRASMLIEQSVTSNKPKAKQRIARILTPFDGKPDPVIVFTLDDCDVMKTCRRTEWRDAILPFFKPNIDPHTDKELQAWFNSNKKKDARSEGFEPGYLDGV